MELVEQWLERVGLYGLPFTAEMLAQKVAEVNGWRLKIAALANMELLGASVLIDQCLLIFHRPDVKGFHRNHVIFHELGHVMLGHLNGAGGIKFSRGQERAAEQVAKELIKRSTGVARYNRSLQESYRKLFE